MEYEEWKLTLTHKIIDSGNDFARCEMGPPLQVAFVQPVGVACNLSSVYKRLMCEMEKALNDNTKA